MTPVRVAIQRAVIHKPANSEPEPCAIQVVRPAAQVIASSPQQRSYAESPEMIGVTRPSFVPATRQHVQRISLSQMVRTSCFSNPYHSHAPSRPKLWDWRASVRQRYLHVIGLYVSLAPGRSLRQDTNCRPAQCQSAGSTLGLTKACPAKNDRSCQVSCQDPRTANQCIVLQTQLVDGSPCGAPDFIYSDSRC